MKVTIDNFDGNGAVDYSQCVVASEKEKFVIRRQMNKPSLCSFFAAPAAAGLTMPVRNGRIVVADDSGNVLFTGYLDVEPALELVGQDSAGAVYQAQVSAVSDEVLLDQQPMPVMLAGVSQTAFQLLESLSGGLNTYGLTFANSEPTGSVGNFLPDAAKNWSANAGALADGARSAYRVVDGVVIMNPVGTVTHTLNEADGTLQTSALQAAMVKTLANDITVCGRSEPAAYVTEFFEGDGTTVLFNLTEVPYFPPVSADKPLIDLFQEQEINPAIWNAPRTGTRITLTSAGLTSAGGDGVDGDTAVTSVNQIEMGGSLVFEAGGVQFGAVTEGILNAIYGGAVEAANCVAGFQISQGAGSTQIAALINGVAAGSPFTVAAGHVYTLRMRIYCNEMQRIEQAYYSVDNTGTQMYGGVYLAAGGQALLEVQDTTNGIASAPVVLYSGSLASVPSTATFGLVDDTNLDCSIARIEVAQQGPVWVTSTPPGGSAVVRRMGTVAQGADCQLDRLGRLQFYPAGIPQAGEIVAVSYRTTHRSVARQSSTASIAAESNGGAIPGTAAWIGSVTHPVPRSSLDCENAASALLDLATNRGAAWQGTYTAWDLETQSDVWPGDVLAITAASAGLSANLVVRAVEIELLCGVPGLVKYTVSFANDWADALAIKTAAAVPEGVWLPQQPQTATPPANLNTLTVASVTASAITVDTGATPPTDGGFEVRRRDWDFRPGTDSDLVLRSPVNSFTIPREAVMERYYIRMYDGSTPPNYSRWSSAVFVNVAM